MVPDLMEGTGIRKSFGESIQDQPLFEGSGIMKSSGDINKKIAQGSTLSTQTKLKGFPEGYLGYLDRFWGPIWF